MLIPINWITWNIKDRLETKSLFYGEERIWDFIHIYISNLGVISILKLSFFFRWKRNCCSLSASISCCLTNPKHSSPELLVCEILRVKSLRTWRKGKWPADFQAGPASGSVKRSKHNGWEGNYSPQMYRNYEQWAVTSILIKYVWFCDFTYSRARNSSSLQFLHLVGDQPKLSGCLP